jgi:hypothetical protein
MIGGGVVMSALIRGGVLMMAEPSPSPNDKRRRSNVSINKRRRSNDG